MTYSWPLFAFQAQRRELDLAISGRFILDSLCRESSRCPSAPWVQGRDVRQDIASSANSVIQTIFNYLNVGSSSALSLSTLEERSM
jgi:hypothetical protein